ncbi:MAG: hypothetical protein JEZ05_05895 [Tenericutes bacterium]|nr:hypothetical protein [Mycoplasmatota bacterium]
MIKYKRLVSCILILTISVLMIACNPNDTERTTTMADDTTSNTVETTVIETTEETVTTKEIIAVEFSDSTIVTEHISVDNLLEIDFFEDIEDLKIADNYNPYDYNEIKVVVEFTKPSGCSVTQTAFWIQEYLAIRVVGEVIDDEGFYTAGQEHVTMDNETPNHYRVRINPDEAGLWNYSAAIVVRGETLQTTTGTFSVSDNSERSAGFIEVDQVNKRNFIFSASDESYFPNGVNLGWPSTTLSTHDYYNWFKELNEVNANMGRIWLANWSYSLHKYSYDDFDSRQNILARLDYLFETAKEFDVYVLLTLINHGQFSAITNPEWAENPYNEANGGMLEYPIQFFYNEEAKTAYKNELMYLISRFGYSENIFAWELFNETDWVDGYSSLVVTRWKDEMAQFIHANDPYNHLVTTSYKYTFGTPGFDLDSLDFATFHSYGFANEIYYEMLNDEMTKLWDKYQKPVLFGEVGIDWQAGSSTYSSDYQGITIHQGMWGGLLSSAGSANQWWWDTWIDRYDLWFQMEGASTYATYMDVANKNYTLLQENNQVTTSDDDIFIIGYLLENEIYGLIYNKMWNYWNSSPDVIQDITVEIPFDNGTYTLSVFDTKTGDILSVTTVTITNGVFTIENLDISEDYAFILK